MRDLAATAPRSVATPRGPGHPFYVKLNGLLAEARFDEWVEDLCRPQYAERLGRPGIPPGAYFRMLLVDYFEGLDSQRGIAWRCADSLALKSFLGYPLTAATPEHSSLTKVRRRLPEDVHEQVFAFVLPIAETKKLLKGKTVGVDATLLEANAAMKSIVRRDTGEDYKQYLRRLAQDAGIDDPSDDDLKKFDKQRKIKASNQEWQSPSDPDARIMKMKDGRTRLSYRAEHAVDLESGPLLAATIHHGDRSDGESLQDTLIAAQTNLIWAGSGAEVKKVPVDNGYHTNEALAQCQAQGDSHVRGGEGRAVSTELDRQAGGVQTGVSCEPAACAWPAREATPEVAQRALRTELCSSVRDRRRAAELAAWAGRHGQALPDPRGRPHTWAG